MTTPAEFSCACDEPSVPLTHHWERMVGSGHATLALRADWQRQLTRCRRELGFRRVRFHGLLSDDVGTLRKEEDQLVYSFFNADQICDFLRSIDVRPVIELSFMPTALSSGGKTVFDYRANVTPPRDFKAWQTLVEKLVQHWVDRYGLVEVRGWLFEVWNEPNLDAFWAGDQAAYFELYAHTARAIKAVDGSLQVGGPATAANAWIPDFLTFCTTHDVPVDFVSTHHYPTDAFGKPGDDTRAQLAASRRSVLRDEAATARAQAGTLPLYYTEWSTSSNPFDELHDLPYAAAFIAKTVMENRDLVDAYSYWTFSDIFEENYFSSVPFHGGFGLLTIDGIAKPAYRAYELLHRQGTELLAVSGSHPTVDVWVSRDDRRITILITNGALPTHPIEPTVVSVRLSGTAPPRLASIARIDDEHANARAAWIAMGRPERLLPGQVAALETVSALGSEDLAFETLDGVIELEVTMPIQGTALIMLER